MCHKTKTQTLHYFVSKQSLVLQNPAKILTQASLVPPFVTYHSFYPDLDVKGTSPGTVVHVTLAADFFVIRLFGPLLHRRPFPIALSVV